MAIREYTTHDAPHRAAARARLRRRQRVRLATAGVLVVVPVALGAQAVATRDAIVPGVSVAGIDLGGQSRSEARATLVAELGRRLSTPVTISVGDVRDQVIPAELGIDVDLALTVERAFSEGRVEERLLPYLWSGTVEPALRLPPELALPPTLSALEQPPRDARPVVRASGKVSVVPAADGLAFDDRAALAAIAAAAVRQENVVILKPVVSHPAIPTSGAERTAEDARRLLSGPIRLAHAGRRLGRIDPAALAPLVKVRKRGDGYTLSLAARGLREALARVAAPVSRPARDARWRTDGRRARVVDSRNGRGVDASKTSANILASAAGTRRAEVVLGPIEPSRTTAEAKALGIKQRISSVTTDLGASSPNRVYNVRLMAGILDGQVIGPGKSFSFNERVGPRTPARGFKEGQAIVGGLLLPSIGGGVCQVATTVFDAAFYAGFPISKRINHAWYISHYAMGMDATVSDGGPDLVFKNDSKFGVLIRASATASTMTVTLYSTDRGLRVTKEPGAPYDFEAPKPRYILNPNLKGAEQSQRTSGQRGFSISVTRVIRRHGKVVKRDSFSSHYIAESVLYIVGATFEPKDGAVVETAPPEFRF